MAISESMSIETPEEFKSLHAWLDKGDDPLYLPEFMRDFHDQKDIFKEIATLYQDSNNADKMPNWVNAHCYTVDWFLYYMASRGYTLQKTRKKGVNFRPLFVTREERKNKMYGFLNGTDNSST